MKLDVIEATQIANTAESEIRDNRFSVAPRTGLPGQTSEAPPTQIITTLVSKLCADSCTCTCHSRIVRRTPGRLQDFIGTLFLGYSGMPMITPPCDNASCAIRSSPTMLFMYTFPTWVLARIFLLVARLSLSQGLEFNIRLPRVLHNSVSIWRSVSTGDIGSTKELFQKMAVTPYDIDGQYGYTTLTVSKTFLALIMQGTGMTSNLACHIVHALGSF